jgi:hypothetical protein
MSTYYSSLKFLNFSDQIHEYLSIDQEHGYFV